MGRAKKVISVNRQAIAQGRPAISVKWRGKTYAATRVHIEGDSTIVSDPDKARQPRVWVETMSRVFVNSPGAYVELP